MPKQGLQMTVGTIVRWIVGEGENGTADQPLFEMETDKLTITMDAPAGGTLLKIVHGEGDVVPITEMIAVIGEEGEIFPACWLRLPRRNRNRPLRLPRRSGRRAHRRPTLRLEGLRRQGVLYAESADVRGRKGSGCWGYPGSGPEGLVIERDVLAFEPAAARKATPLAKKRLPRRKAWIFRILREAAHTERSQGTT